MSQAAHEYDPNDPHGAQAGHDHVIVSWKMLVSILLILLCLTALTVFIAQSEQWVMAVWGITLPTWVNLVGAMSIATVKALLVAGFFMQLKYDKPLNTITMLFCLLCVWLFVMFCMIDLGSRDKVLDFKAEIKVPGGTGQAMSNTLDPDSPAIMSARLSPHVNTGGQSIAQFRFEQALNNFPDESLRGTKIADKYFDDPYYTEDTERAFWHHYYDSTYVSKGKAPHHHERDKPHYYESFLEQNHARLAELGIDVHHDDGHGSSSANQSRPVHGLTPGLFDESVDTHADPGHTEAETSHE